jgi:general secretion pathway protein E
MEEETQEKEEDSLKFTAEKIDIPFIPRLEVKEISQELINKVPINFAKQNKVIPLYEKDGAVIVAMGDPLDLATFNDIQLLLGKEIKTIAVPSQVILETINEVYERRGVEEELDTADISEESEEDLQDLLDLTDEAPIIRWVNSLFYQALKERASDIHIEPGEKEVLVRYRIDGVLYDHKRANKGYLPSIISRIKIMAGMNIAEKRLPQDGRIRLKIAGQDIDVRVSTIPTSYGERVAMRLLERTSVLLPLSDLGFSSNSYALMENLINRTHGILLVTGPTGCGKTTTLYACINKINTPELNILTVEDPVEYQIKGISQMQVNPKINLTFATGLRHFLRQDPDIIMVGEIRDRETAEIAIHASLTGHLVLSTIHTNDAAGAITRLVEMGIEPFLVASSMIAILAQRLIRIVCSKCRVPYRPKDKELDQLGITLEELHQRALKRRESPYFSGAKDPLFDNISDELIFYRASGCEKCLGTGYLGRTGIYELLLVTDRIRSQVLKNADSSSLKRTAIEEGMDTLRDDGARKVFQGISTVEEIMRVTQEEI